MIGQASKLFFLSACLLLSGWLPATGQEISPAFRIKPSEVQVPDGAELGHYRRTIQPFDNWELRCDENLKARKKICNITQTVLDKDGQFAFGWSLAAMEDGKPVMILRTRPGLGVKKPVTLTFSGRQKPLIAETNGCDISVCVALLPVGPLLRAQIAKEATVHISYEAAGLIEFDTPLKGISAALSAIK